MEKTTFDNFLKIDIRCGIVTAADEFPEARKPAYKLTIDFGPDVGVKKSSVQITELYKTAELLGKQVAAVVNFPPRQIGPFMSEVLVLGFENSEGAISLVGPDSGVPNGSRLC